MGWNRQAAYRVKAPTPLLLGRWMMVAVVSVLAGVLLFLLSASDRMPHLQGLNIWVLSVMPLMLWILVFGARAYAYGSALSHYQFLKDEAQAAQQAWQAWAQRYMTVCVSCVLLPDQVSASVLTQKDLKLPPRTGQACRIAALPERDERAQAGLKLLFPALKAALQALPAESELRVTLLSDIEPCEYSALHDRWEQTWAIETQMPQPEVVTVTNELSYQWIEEILKTASAAFELILVLQVHGKTKYSDGLAALLLCPDRLLLSRGLQVQGAMLRPMPLDINALKNDLPLFLQAQVMARQASGLLADSDVLQPVANQFLSFGDAHVGSLKVEQQWVYERFCGLPGPFNHWLLAALGVELAQHQQGPLLVLTNEQSQYWIGTVTPGELS